MTRTINILYAEDNEHDIIATKRAWKKYGIENTLHIVKDGEECLDFLYRRGQYSDPVSAPMPFLLLLDLNMPKLDGLGVLREIKKNDALKHIHVVVLTTSNLDKDRVESYNLGVQSYIMKPVGFQNFAEAIKSINLFWEIVEPVNNGSG